MESLILYKLNTSSFFELFNFVVVLEVSKVTELGSEDNESLVLAGKQHLLEHVRVEVLGVNNISSSHEVKLLFELVWEGLNIILTTKVELR